ncbi:uncharacterized protein [Argopecten irradians]|uniref:uncharacterized protein isoform X2 n=1 Tax=Argopecten irradians TaxID=31199 RepID=UPI0037233AA0
MLPPHCKILLRHEVQKHFESGRQVMETVVKIFATHMKSFKTQSKEKVEAEVILKELGGVDDDVKEIFVTLAAFNKENGLVLKDLGKRLDSPVSMLNRWLNDSTVKTSEAYIMDNIDMLTDQHIHLLAKITKLHKVYNKKRRLMDRVQKQIDSYPFSDTEISLPDLEVKREHFKLETLTAEHKYRNALDNETRNRLQFIKKVAELKSLFTKHEEKRLMILVDSIREYSSILTACYDDPRDKMRAFLTDLTELSLVYCPEDHVEKFIARGCRELTFPTPQFEEELHSIQNTGKNDQKVNLESMVQVPNATPTEQLNRTTDTSGNAKRRNDESKCEDVYSQYTDNKVNCLPSDIFHEPTSGHSSESTAHLNTPSDVTPDRGSHQTPSALPLLPKANMCEETLVKISPRPQTKLEGLHQIASPDTTIQRIFSKPEKKPVKLRQGDAEQEANQLPKLPRSLVGTHEETKSKCRDIMEQSQRKPKVDTRLVKSMVDRDDKSGRMSQNGSSSPLLTVRVKSRMDGHVLPRMPMPGNGMIASHLKAKGNQENVNQGNQAPWISSKTTSLPQLSPRMASKDNKEKCNIQSNNNVVDIATTKLPVVLKPGKVTASISVSFANQSSQIAKPAVSSRPEGFTILPSKPKVFINPGNVQSFMVRPTDNSASDTFRSRHRVGVKQSGHVSSGLAAGFRGSSNNRDSKSQHGIASGNTPQRNLNSCVGSQKTDSAAQRSPGMDSNLHRPNTLMSYNLRDQQGMAMTLQEPRGKADGAADEALDGAPLMIQVSESKSGLQSQRFQAVNSTNRWMRKERLSDQGTQSERKSGEQDNIRNADRLLKQYDIRNLGIGDNDEKEDICEKADRLLAMHDIRNICSDESLLEQEM